MPGTKGHSGGRRRKYRPASIDPRKAEEIREAHAKLLELRAQWKSFVIDYGHSTIYRVLNKEGCYK